MRIFGIVSEYNPFHNGHKYLIDMARSQGATHIIAVMSGNFVQRGETSCVDKFKRAIMAVSNGADLVLELPVCYSLSTAEFFSHGAVSLLNSLGCVDSLVFGAETADTFLLGEIAEFTEAFSSSTALKEKMSEGISYPQALETAVYQKMGSKCAEIISSPNNLLGIEYIKALRQLNSTIRPVAVERTAVKHNSDEASDGFASASYIRKNIKYAEISHKYMPQSAFDILKQAYKENSLSEQSLISPYILNTISEMTREEIENLPDVSHDLAGRIFNLSKNVSSYGELIRKAVSKNYTESRIKRLCLSAMLNIPRGMNRKLAPYGRILAFNHGGCDILKEIKKTSKIPVSTSLSDLAEFSEKAEIFARLEAHSTDIFNMTIMQEKPVGSDYRQKVTKW